MNLPDDILIVGLGTTGIATARFLSRLGKRITLVDEKHEKDLAPALKALDGVPFTGRFGPHRQEDFLGHPMIVLSPGIDSEHPYLKEARAAGIKVIGEMELAYTFLETPVIAITGTNGKTTVTTLMGEIFTKAYGDVFVGGNIGDPLVNYLLSGAGAGYVIIEVSSFQLETIETFRPDAAILLNVTEDHLDRYRSFAEYRDAKYRIFENQRPEDYAILNTSLPPLGGIRARKLCFSTERGLEEGAFLKDGTMYVRLEGKEYRHERAVSPLVGIHNTENLLVALLTAYIHGIKGEVIEDVIKTFTGLSHRIEPVRRINGITFYNDSKATNVDSTRRALESIGGSVVLIAGGKDKGGSYRVIGDQMPKVRSLILIGEGAERIREELGSYTKTYMEGDLAGAVSRAVEVAQKGDVVLFSPMCSSFDMFKDYKDRGNRFRALVEAL
ncbi:UDP-N-acetylmuramoyl-L-alanine--D-glutamate ligase [Syntrophorhabdus aromaticivorans]|jgi:UDP-N-acetylmuramoylalanine--D-glutamate ligase|uniref:UDP-N-acetylmuramoylalanine--D-glutamate ligase n=1 Tax=Syntrophorhabdus aromaticivorans TaxID=328301 RepID=A0A971S2W0_9BACT|nr:UDP-N-acetylmuramoyl-L-alanine--D-glutamate ligase [Syntrophorhabdus aromaticivorans]NLW36722.1 UDP-N-acetylmuramoyl-L-alanine--D-glutamate ligase [Syntrophorhabdus aromaticivorans]